MHRIKTNIGRKNETKIKKSNSFKVYIRCYLPYTIWSATCVCVLSEFARKEKKKCQGKYKERKEKKYRKYE
jgi:hypothetical protein